jgi:hypothetical protein
MKAIVSIVAILSMLGCLALGYYGYLEREALRQSLAEHRREIQMLHDELATQREDMAAKMAPTTATMQTLTGTWRGSDSGTDSNITTPEKLIFSENSSVLVCLSNMGNAPNADGMVGSGGNIPGNDLASRIAGKAGAGAPSAHSDEAPSTSDDSSSSSMEPEGRFGGKTGAGAPTGGSDVQNTHAVKVYATWKASENGSIVVIELPLTEAEKYQMPKQLIYYHMTTPDEALVSADAHGNFEKATPIATEGSEAKKHTPAK